MEFFSIIIDRVASTNVFNIIQGRLPSRDTHLQSIVDDDLISEFLSEIDRLSRISNSLSDNENAVVPFDISGELRRIGETFFLQFFPQQIQDRLREADSGFLFLHVDHKLRNVPWELLHDGSCFLADKFFMGKNISGFWRDNPRPERDRLRFLIIADPTEDLEWARLEGEGLFESLNAEVSADRLDVQFMAGRRISKLNILNAIKDRDIIHFAGHLFHSRDQQESGWLLSGDKVLRAREIEKAGFAPDLVFSNSCLSSPVLSPGPRQTGLDVDTVSEGEGARFNDLAGAFLKAGICSYIGTNWEIKDNKKTYDFALNFYRAIFEEKSVGEALHEARIHARRSYPATDLTWANYVLHGNPMARIFRSANRRTFDASRNILNARRIEESYPMPIALEYARFQEMLSKNAPGGEILAVMIGAFEKTMQVVGAVVFGNYNYLNMKGAAPDTQGGALKSWMDLIYECIANINALSLELAASGLMEALQMHRDAIYKLITWRNNFLAGGLSQENQDSYLVTFQYLFDNLLTDLASLRRYRIIYLFEDGKKAMVLHGRQPETINMLPEEFREPVLQEMLQRNHSSVCFYNSSRKIILSLDPYMRLDTKSNIIVFPEFTKPSAAVGTAQQIPAE